MLLFQARLSSDSLSRGMAKGSFLKSITRALKSVGLRRCGARRSRKVSKRSRKNQKNQKNQKTQRGGGYSETLNNSIYPGQQVHTPYGGPGYDCAGTATRPGALNGIGMLQNPGGLAGLSPGLLRGGGSQLGSGGPVVSNNGTLLNGGRRRRYRRKQQQQGGTILGVAVQDGSYPGTPASGTPAQAVLQEGAVPANVNAARAQSGGRYGMEGSPLDPVRGIGMSGYAPIGRVACESGTLDALNPDPALQAMTTNRMTYGVPGFTPVMRGGRSIHKQRRLPVHKRTQKKKSKRQSGGVVVGQVDAMRYYAPTAGYSNSPLMPQVPNNPGILMQTGYPAGHFNQACLKTN